MVQNPTVKLSITERSALEFEHVTDVAAMCSKVSLQVAKDGRVYKAAALPAYHADHVSEKIDLEFDRLALEVLGVDVSDPNACLTAILQAPWAQLQVHEGAYGEAVFLVPKLEPKA